VIVSFALQSAEIDPARAARTTCAGRSRSATPSGSARMPCGTGGRIDVVMP
jgi:hypothetical protein